MPAKGEEKRGMKAKKVLACAAENVGERKASSWQNVVGETAKMAASEENGYRNRRNHC